MNVHFGLFGISEQIIIVVVIMVAAYLISKRTGGTRKLNGTGQSRPRKRPVSEEKKFWRGLYLVGAGLVALFAVGLVLVVLAFFMLWQSKAESISTHKEVTFNSAPPAEFVSSDAAPSPPKPVKRIGLDLTKQRKRIEDWKKDLPFPVDLYSSVESCAAPVARMIQEELNSKSKTQTLEAEAEEESEVESYAKSFSPPTEQTIVVNVENLRLFKSGYADSFYRQFKAAYKKLAPNVKIVGDGEKIKNKSSECKVEFSLTNTETYTDGYVGFPPRKVRKGKLLCKLKLIEGAEKYREKRFTVQFSETPWLNDDFTKLSPSGRFYVGLSQSLEKSNSTARELAIQDLAKQLGIPPEDVEPLVSRYFPQKITRPYGSVYRAAVLVDLGKKVGASSPASVASAQSYPSYRYSKGIARGINPERGIAVLAIMTVVLALVANAITQGYYRLELSRTAIILCSIAAIFIILVVLGSVIG